MDNIKDNLLNNVQYKENNLPFDYNNSEIIFLINKTEKIVQALYILTDLLEEKEPIRNNIREISSTILKDILSINHRSSSNLRNIRESVNNSLFNLASLLDIGQTIGIFSAMNVTILKEEFKNLSDKLIVQKIIEKGQPALKKTYFDTKKIKDTNSVKDIKDRLGNKGQNVLKTPEVTYIKSKQTQYGTNLDSNLDKTTREQKILDLIRKAGISSIKDISTSFPEISEKTIQRELLKMVDNGLLQKIGERRWSKYQIIE